MDLYLKEAAETPLDENDTREFRVLLDIRPLKARLGELVRLAEARKESIAHGDLTTDEGVKRILVEQGTLQGLEAAIDVFLADLT